VVRGSLTFQVRCHPAFDYARAAHETVVDPGKGADFHSAGLSLRLATEVKLRKDERGVAAELEPLLRTAATVQVLSRVSPREEARLEGRAAFLQAAAKRSQPAAIIPRPVVRRRPWVAFVPAAIAAALFAAIAIPVLGSMDTGSTPGDWNYGFKRATERIRLAITTDPGERRLLRLEFADRWIDAHIGRWISYRVISMQAAGRIPNHEASMGKLFMSEMPQRIAALAHARGAVVVVDAVLGVEVQTEKVWSFADEFKLPRAVVINKLDRDRSSLDRALGSVNGIVGRSAVPIQLPIGSEGAFKGIIKRTQPGAVGR